MDTIHWDTAMNMFPMSRLRVRLLELGASTSRRVDRYLQDRARAAWFTELGVQDVDSIRTWTTRRELDTLYRLASSCPPEGSALEIGSYLGASSCYLAAGLRRVSGRLFCLDTWENQTMPEGERDTYQEFKLNTAPFAESIVALRKRSEELTVQDVATPLDLVFIDGDHDYDNAAADFARISPWVASGGTVAFHDVGNPDYPGVGRLVGQIIESGGWTPGGVTQSLVWLRKS